MLAVAGPLPLHAMPIWELVAPPPPPPLPHAPPPPLPPLQKSTPTAATSRPRSKPVAATTTVAQRPLQWELVSPAQKTPPSPLILANDQPLSPLLSGVASPGLSASTGFPTVASGGSTGLIWELAPPPGSLPNLLAIASSVSSSSVLLDAIPVHGAGSPTPGATVQPSGLIEAPAPLHTASGLRWELVDDPKAVLAEQPDPESLTTPVSQRYQPPFLLSPYIGGAVPSAYVAGWGDFYISGSAATPGKRRDGNIDGSLNMGMGFGNADRFVAVEVDWGIGSIKNFNYNGGFSGSIGRNLINNGQLSLAISGGVIELYDYGNEADNEPASPYGVVSLTVPLRPNNAFFQQNLQLSIGGGGSAFAWQNENFEGPDAGLFAALGVEITRNTGISAAWSGRGLNANVSYVPFRDVPISVNILAADVFNNSPYGRVGVLTLTWGSNFANGLF